MKKILSAFIVVVLVTVAILLFACAKEQPHVCVYTYRTVAPTCVAEGYTEHVCLDCGKYYRDNFTVVEDLTKDESHVLGDWYTSTEPDCKKTEKFRRDCLYCDYQTKEVTEYKDADGKIVKGAVKHTYHKDYRILVPATCTEKAYYIYICLYCEKYESDKNGSSVKDINGKSFGSPANSNSLGHDHAVIREIAPSCGHNADGSAYETYGIKEYAPCTRCGATKNAEYKLPHSSASSKVVAPTCTAAGYTEHTCKICGEIYHRDYTEASHIWPKTADGKTEIWSNPYTKVDGWKYEQRACTVCGAIEERICSEQ